MSNTDKKDKPGLEDCILPPIATRVVTHHGFILKGVRYTHPALSSCIGLEVMLFKLGKDVIGVCLGSDYICSSKAIDTQSFPRLVAGNRVKVKATERYGVVNFRAGKGRLYSVRLDGDINLSDFSADELTLIGVQA